ncbi:MAG TPA: TonB-dependent receptor plug domain-containing protein, partial [Chitinophagaceae bacterium]
MRKVILLTVLSFTTYIFAYSQKKTEHVLSGKITDKKTGASVPGASISIPDIKINVIADDNGNFKTPPVPPGTYLVEVSSIGYKSESENISFNDNNAHDFKLEENFTESSEVVVTGLSQATQIKRNPVPIISVGHDYLVSNLSTNAIDAIAKLPGIHAVTTGPNISKPYIRGLGFNRILTLYDGVRQEGQQWGDEHGIEVDQYGVQKVEVIKGPASLSYGSDALAGVINLIPVSPAPEGK